MRKLIYSSNTMDRLENLPEEEKIRILEDEYGVDEDMYSDVDKALAAVAGDDFDLDDFDYVVEPMISEQTKDGIVLLVGTSSRWDGTKQAGAAVYASDLPALDRDVDLIRIYDDGEGLEYEGIHHDGLHRFKMYAIPENDLENFVIKTGMVYSSEYAELGDDVQAVEDAIEYLNDPKTIEDSIDFAKVQEYCDRIKNTQGLEAINESLTEAKAKNPKNLEQELLEIKPLSDEYGYEYFTAMPFTAFDNDPESIEIKYPEFFRVVKSFFKEMGLLSKEELNNPDVLDEHWDTDIDERDWAVLMRTCALLVKGTSVQIEKIFKDTYKPIEESEEVTSSSEIISKIASKMEKEPFTTVNVEDNTIYIHDWSADENSTISVNEDGSIDYYDIFWQGSDDPDGYDDRLERNEHFNSFTEFVAYAVEEGLNGLQDLSINESCSDNINESANESHWIFRVYLDDMPSGEFDEYQDALELAKKSLDSGDYREAEIERVKWNTYQAYDNRRPANSFMVVWKNGVQLRSNKFIKSPHELQEDIEENENQKVGPWGPY